MRARGDQNHHAAGKIRAEADGTECNTISARPPRPLLEFEVGTPLAGGGQACAGSG